MGKSLSSRIFSWMFIGLIIGSLFQYGLGQNEFVQNYLVAAASGLGSMFVSLIKLLVLPLVFISIVYGICQLKDIASFGRLGTKTFSLYLANTCIAITAAIILGVIFKPGLGADLAHGEALNTNINAIPSLGQLVMDIIPSNPVAAFAEGNVLQVIFMAILTGLAIQALDHRGGPAIEAFRMANEVMMKLVSLVMSLAPYGVFCLMINLGATLESETLLSVLGYVALVVALLVFWIFVAYPFFVFLATGISPKVFLLKIREQVLFSLTTASSNATIPVTMRTLTEKLGVQESVAGFGVPLGATMNMSGVAIYIILATLFVANAYEVELGLSQLVSMGLTTFLLAVGAGGVPGGGIVMIGVLMHQLGLPMEALAIVAAVDRVNDMFCTCSNVVGDTAVNTIVAKSEQAIDVSIANSTAATYVTEKGRAELLPD